MSDVWVLSDIEGTLTKENTWTLLVKQPQLDRARVRWFYAKLIPLALAKKLGIINDMTFRDLWCKALAPVFTGWTQPQVAEVFVQVAQRAQYHQDTSARLQAHTKDQQSVLLISGMFSEGAAAIAQHLGLYGGVGTALAYDAAGRCTGRVAGPCCAGAAKLEIARDFLGARGITADLQQSYAYADTLSDLPLLSAVRHPVPTHADDELRAEATKRGWALFPSAGVP
jgi:HAD superfamily phosphoserine phosphatase-like hydrolase